MPVTLKVRDVMESGVVILDGNLSAMDALKAMLENQVWSIVVSINDLPSGVVTDRDLLRRVVAKGLDMNKTLLKEIMTSPLITISPDATFAEAWKLMTEKNIRRLYVVEKGKIIGRVTQTGLFNKLLEVMMAISSIKYLM
ncbi:MAG: cyclic nucleotide-binding/CBS domain-containing protein [Thermoprotei archaeon]|jgi:CBS domain-containing protein